MNSIEQRGMFEMTLKGPADWNLFVEVKLSAEFSIDKPVKRATLYVASLIEALAFSQDGTLYSPGNKGSSAELYSSDVNTGTLS